MGRRKKKGRNDSAKRSTSRVLAGAAATVAAMVAMGNRVVARCAKPVVVEHGALKYLMRGTSVLGAQRLDDRNAAAFRGWAVQRATVDVLRPRAKEALVIGLGSGSVPTHWRRPPRRLKVDAVDLDPEVIALAESSFGLAPGTTIVGDGINVLYATPKKYDVIVVDVVDPEDPYGPGLWRFLEKDALVAAKKSLAERTGLLAFTVVAGLLDDDALDHLGAVAARLGAAFPKMRAYRDSPFTDAGATNVVFFAGDDDIFAGPMLPPRRVAEGSEAWVVANFRSWEVAACDDGTCRHTANASRPTFRADAAAPRPATGYGKVVAAGLRAHFSDDLRRRVPASCRAAAWLRRRGKS